MRRLNNAVGGVMVNREWRGCVKGLYICVGIKRLLSAAAVILLLAAASAVTAARVVQTGAQQGLGKLYILMYHGLTENVSRQNQYMIDPELLESDLEYISSHGYKTMFISEVIECVEKGRPLPEKAVVLSFDDGFYNNYLYAFPLLKKYNCRAVISPICRPVDEAEKDDYRTPDYSQCRWDELKEMTDSGLVELQNHTYDLHHLSGGVQGVERRGGESEKDYQTRLREDLSRANDLIREKTGTEPTALTLPFGAGGAEAVELAGKMGFKAVLDCEEKTNYLSGKDDLFHLHRYLRPKSMSAQEFFKKLGMD